MGGIAILGGTVAGYVVGNLRPGGDGFAPPGCTLMVLVLWAWAWSASSTTTWASASSATWASTSGPSRRASSLVAAIFAVLAVNWIGVSTEVSFTRDLGAGPRRLGLRGLWAVLIIVATANAVNLTDGLDGLASGSAALVAAAFVIIAFWQVRHVERLRASDAARGPRPRRGGRRRPRGLRRLPVVERGAGPHLHGRHRVPGPGRSHGRAGPPHPHPPAAAHPGRAVRARDAVGGHPGHRPSGASSAGSSAWRRSTTTSSCPGWPEFTVIVRFWLITGLFVAFGLGLFYADFIRIPGALD